MHSLPFTAVVVGVGVVWTSTLATATPTITPGLARPSIETSLVEKVGWRRRHYWRYGYPVPYVYYPPAHGYYVPPPAYAYPPTYPPAYGEYPPPPANGDYGDYPPPSAEGDYNGDYPAESGY